MFCCKCGTQLPDGSVFCMNCGCRLGEAAAPAAPVAPVAPVVPVAPATPVQVEPPVVPVQVAPPVTPVAPAAPVVQVAPPVTPVNFNTPAAPVEEAEAGATTALTPDQAPAYMIPPSADDAEAGATTALTPDQAPAYMASQPAQPVPSAYHPYTPPAAPAPKKRSNALLIGIIAIVAVIALTLGALWATGAFDDLFGSTKVSDKDDKDDDDDKGDGEDDDNKDGPVEGDDSDVTGTTTTTTGSADTIVTQAPTITQPTEGTDAINPSVAYNKGYIDGNTYYNEWADLTYVLPSDWENGSDADYTTYAGLNTECGLYLKRLNTTTYTYEQFVIALEKLPYANYGEDAYIQSVLNQLESQYTTMGLQMEIGDIGSIVMAGKSWTDVTITINNGALYQRFAVTEVDGYMIAITISTVEATTSEQMLMNFAN